MVRKPILYAEEMWRRQRFFVLFLLVAGVAFPTAWYVTKHRFDLNDNNVKILALYLPIGLLMLGLLAFYRWRSQVTVSDDGIRIGGMRHMVDIDFDHIRAVKVQPLASAFLDDRQRIAKSNVVVRNLIRTNAEAVFIRLRGDEEYVDNVIRRLGSRIGYENQIALPVAEARVVADAIAARIPNQNSSGGNLGGQRRRGGRRR